MRMLGNNRDPQNMHSWHGGNFEDQYGRHRPNHHQFPPVVPNSHQNPLVANASPFRRQPSLRKTLPSVPDMETQMSLSAKMIDRRTSTPKGNHSYGPFFLEYSLLAEYNLLQKQKMPGVYVVPSAKSPLCWFGVIFVRQGLYQGGVFRFKIVIPDNFPDGDCPRFLFDSALFHPYVDPNSYELNLHKGFPKWKRNVHHLWQILLFARRSFYKIDIADRTQVRNEEAATLYESNPAGFKAKVADCVEQWRIRLYDDDVDVGQDDPHYIRFSPFESDKHESVRTQLLDGSLSESPEFLSKSLDAATSSSSAAASEFRLHHHLHHPPTNPHLGYSFMEKGSFRMFSHVNVSNHSSSGGGGGGSGEMRGNSDSGDLQRL